MTIKELLSNSIKKITSSLYFHSEKEYIVSLFVQDFLQINKASFFLKLEKEAPAALPEYLDEVIPRLNANEPFQYILEKEDFFDYTFYVNKNVLIPRPETEELVAWVLDCTKKQENLKILDIGTGSGCIPISLFKEKPNAQLFGVDVSTEAIAVAQKNNENLGASVSFQVCDILDENQWKFDALFDVIISNPPYIPVEEKDLMQANVLDFEPSLALFVENENPLLFYTKIAKFSASYLKPKGLLFFECNEFNAQAVKNMLSETNLFEDIILKKDINEKERMILAKRK